MDDASMSRRRRCDECRYWSEMIARIEGTVLQAYCLSGNGTQAGKFTAGSQTCASWSEATHGAVDDPAHAGIDPYMVEA